MIDKRYRKETLLDWERKSLIEKFSIFSLSKKSTWLVFGLILLGLAVFALIVPFIPPRYGSHDWSPPANMPDYINSISRFLIVVPTVTFAVLVYVNVRNSIDLQLNIKQVGNFRVLEVLNLAVLKLVVLSGFRLFTIKPKAPYFKSVVKGQIITIKKTGTLRLINYYIRDEKNYQEELRRAKAVH